MSIEAMKQWLEALDYAADNIGNENDDDVIGDARRSLRQAIAEAEQAQPVAVVALNTSRPWMGGGYNSGAILPWTQAPAQKFVMLFKDLPLSTPLYTAPPPRQPLMFPTMLRKMWSGSEVQAWLDENVNGIKEKT
jgi:hypothetical protein